MATQPDPAPQAAKVQELAAADDVTATIRVDPADEQGEQWHGVHSIEHDLREPRRQPGGVQRTVEPDCGGDHRA